MERPEVVVIGAGPVGVATVVTLSARKVGRILWIDDSPGFGHGRDAPLPPSWAWGLNTFWPSLNDPPTRAHVAHGREVALALNELCASGVREFKRHLAQLEIEGIGVSSTPLRFAVQDFERVELGKAVSQNLGVTPLEAEGVYREEGTCLTLQDSGLWWRTVMAELSRSRGVGFRAARVVGLGESSTGCALALDDGSSVSTEMVVLGSGVRISELLPEYAETLVPMSDGLHGLGWGTDATGGVPGSIPFPSGKHVHKETTEELLCWRASSGHAAGVILARGPGAAQGRTGWARFSGPRFLLPGAGAGINFLKSGANEARSKLGSLFGFQKSALLPMAAKAARVQGLDAFLPDALEYVKSRDTSDFSLLGVDSLPCDELPLLGELGRWGRVLGGAGWLGCGYSAGWKTGSVLAEMVASGTCSDALGFLSPRRLKTQS